MLLVISYWLSAILYLLLVIRYGLLILVAVQITNNE